MYGERAQNQRNKAKKDLIQASALVDYLLCHDALELALLWNDVTARGPGWRRRLAQGYQAMLALHPELDLNSRLMAATKDTINLSF